jgi:hypothetical protein
VPEQSEKAMSESRKKLEGLEKDKAKEEQALQQVMASLHTETKVGGWEIREICIRIYLSF